jgi:hypothetical protein
MSYGKSPMHPAIKSCLAALAAFCAVVAAPSAYAAAPTLHIVARITPEAGDIADAAMIGTDHVALLFPDAGHIADYTLDGQLYQHLYRESGMQHRFRPTACTAVDKNGLAVFDEAARQVFIFGPDGNAGSGIDLAYPTGSAGKALVLSTVGDIMPGANGALWAMLPERGVLACFDKNGRYQQKLDLAAALPYPNAVYTRTQLLPDGSLFVLDYHQGAVIYREQQEQHFHRLQLGVPEGLEAAPMVQDFAVDEHGNALVVTNIEGKPVVLLSHEDNGYNLHTVDLKLPVAAGRLACRYSRGKFILWLKEKPFVILLELH